MNTLEFDMTNERRLTCKLSLKNKKEQNFKTRKSIVLLKELENELANVDYNITCKRDTVSIVCDNDTKILFNNFKDLKKMVSTFTPDLIDIIEETIYDQSQKKVIKVKKAFVKSNIAMSFLITGLFINSINLSDSITTKAQNLISNTGFHKINEELYNNLILPEYELLLNGLNFKDNQEDISSKSNSVEVPECLADSPENDGVEITFVPTVRTDNYSIDISCCDKSSTDDTISSQSPYVDIANEIGAKWGISPNLLLGMMTQESHCSGSNLMQIQSYSVEDELMEIYNFNEGKYVKYVVTKNPSKYSSNVTTISPSELSNPYTNISVAAIIYRHVMSKYAQNNPIAAIEIYNKGTGNFNQSVRYAGISDSELANDLGNVSYLDYSYVSGAGDPNYVENIMQYVNGDITISMLDENNEVYYIDYTINKTKEKELTK